MDVILRRAKTVRKTGILHADSMEALVGAEFLANYADSERNAGGPEVSKLLGYAAFSAATYATAAIKKIFEPIFLAQQLPLDQVAVIFGLGAIIELVLTAFTPSLRNKIGEWFPNGGGSTHLTLLLFRAVGCLSAVAFFWPGVEPSVSYYTTLHILLSLAHTICFICGRTLPMSLDLPPVQMALFNKYEMYGMTIGSVVTQLAAIATSVAMGSGTLSPTELFYPVASVAALAMGCEILRGFFLRDGKQKGDTAMATPTKKRIQIRQLFTNRNGYVVLASAFAFETFLSVFSLDIALFVQPLLELTTTQFSVFVIIIELTGTGTGKAISAIGCGNCSFRGSIALYFSVAVLFTVSFLLPWASLPPWSGVVLWGLGLGIVRALFSLGATLCSQLGTVGLIGSYPETEFDLVLINVISTAIGVCFSAVGEALFTGAFMRYVLDETGETAQGTTNLTVAPTGNSSFPASTYTGLRLAQPTEEAAMFAFTWPVAIMGGLMLLTLAMPSDYAIERYRATKALISFNKAAVEAAVAARTNSFVKAGSVVPSDEAAMAGSEGRGERTGGAMAAKNRGMTNIQAALWPATLPTDPATVAAIYDASADSYGTDSLADGWHATFNAMRLEFEEFVEERRANGCARGPLCVLDAGCGGGLLVEHIALPAGTVLSGNDLSARQLDIARAKNSYRSLCVADCSLEQPYKSDAFDFIFSNGVLGYVASNAPLAHLIRVLQPGGRMVLCFRHQQWQERHYEEAVSGTSGARLLRTKFFDPYPNNPTYQHDYICATILKE